MHRAFLLPEVVASILDAGKEEPNLLYHSLFVNKLVFLEASRILWKGCYSMFTVGYPTPKIRHLGNMLLDKNIGRVRAQFYANLIQVLIFGEENTGEHPAVEEARWHSQIRELRFPQLKELAIWKTELAEKLNTEDALLHYVHPGLRRLALHASGPLSDLFLDELSVRCASLQELHIDSRNTTITKEGLEHCLHRMHSLKSLKLGVELEHAWDQGAFAAASQYENLELLKVPAIPDSWFDSPHPPLGCNAFKSLRYFYCLGLTGYVLSQLCSRSPRLKALQIYNESRGETPGILSAAAKFTHLEWFQFQPGIGTRIMGHEVVQLAQSCPTITSLSIGQDIAVPPPAIGITDGAIDLLAQNLPYLRELHLFFDSESHPGIAAQLRSFSQYCTTLEILHISCSGDWQSITTLPQRVLFLKLWTFTLCPKDHMEQSLSEREYDELLQYWKKLAPIWFPKVSYFSIKDSDEWEQDFEDFLWEVSY